MGVLTCLSCGFSLTGQQPEDSLTVDYDSLQDVRVDRLEWWFSRSMEQLDRARSESDREIDSLRGVLQGVRHLNRELGLQNSQQFAQIEELEETANRQQQAFTAYRGRLHTTLWVTGSILLALLFASFLFLLLRSERTRHLLAKLRGEFKVHRKEYRRELKARSLQQRKELKAQRKELKAQQKELKAQQKELKVQQKELKVQHKVQHKEHQRELKKRFNQLRRKKR
jgi:DNA repair exonuclease SbcCD ATPase subunit